MRKIWCGDRKMTKEDIKKALTCCSNPGISYCKDCPYANYGEFDCCNGKMYKDVLNLIAEQEKEIERLKAEYEELQTNAEILASGVRDLNHENYELTKKVKQSQIDVLNELKKRIYDISPYNPLVAKDNVKYYIDKLIKEVQNAEDKG